MVPAGRGGALRFPAAHQSIRLFMSVRRNASRVPTFRRWKHHQPKLVEFGISLRPRRHYIAIRVLIHEPEALLTRSMP